jgi:hypothetical protein
VFFCDQSGDHNNVQVRFNERGTVESDYTTNILYVGGDGLMGRPASSTLRAEYPKPFVSRNGDMYFFSRMIPYSSHELSVTHDGQAYRAALRPQVYLKSTDNGMTWSAAKFGIMRTNETDYLTEPYLTQVVAEPPRDGVEERIHFTWTLAAGICLWNDGDGSLRYNYHNAHANNIYHAYFVPAEDKFFSMDGTDLGEAILDEEMDNHCLVRRTMDNVYPLPMTNEQYNEVRSNMTSIMGNYAIVDDVGNVTVNGRYRWNGNTWVEILSDLPSDTRLVSWKNGEYIAYNGVSHYHTDDLTSQWESFGPVDFTGTAVEDRLSNLGMKKSCPPAGFSHPEARVWIKAYPSAGSRYGGFAALAGHHSSYIADRVILDLEDGTASAGDQVAVNGYIVDENGARILTATNSMSFSSEIGVFSEPTTNSFQGLGKSLMTINDDVTPGEYSIEVISEGLSSGRATIRISVDDK